MEEEADKSKTDKKVADEMERERERGREKERD
jgi:hypothetical protein